MAPYYSEDEIKVDQDFYLDSNVSSILYFLPNPNVGPSPIFSRKLSMS